MGLLAGMAVAILPVEKKEEAKMDIDLIFKIAGTGIIVAVLNLVLKRAERKSKQ